MTGVRDLCRDDILAHGLADVQRLDCRESDGQAKGFFWRSLRRFPGWPVLALVLCRMALSRHSVPFGLWVYSIAGLSAPYDEQRRTETSRVRARWAWEYARLLAWLDTARLPASTLREIRAKRIAALDQARRATLANIRLIASIAFSRACYEKGGFADALAAADEAVQIAPEHAAAMQTKAYALAADDRFAEAQAILHRLAEREPENPEFRRKLQTLEKLPGGLPRPRSDRSPEHRLLVAIGGGIGDILHATPMIGNLARRIQTPVDVLVMGDHPEAEFLVRNSEFVGSVFPLSPEVVERRYDTVYLTHCFGQLRFGFNAGRVLMSSDWVTFRPGRLQETLFHLEAAKHLLGIDYEEPDAGRYFVADLRYASPPEPLIGFHAGSKTGRWFSKRWPNFGEFATRLRARGFRVASFGTPDEYVSGTEDCTGGSIEAMSQSMMACSHFVSNDSGPMHIANALGIPVLAIFAPTDPLTHLPLGARTEALTLEKYCAPCEVKNHRHFAAGACRCIREVALDEVEARLLARMEMDNSGQRRNSSKRPVTERQS